MKPQLSSRPRRQTLKTLSYFAASIFLSFTSSSRPAFGGPTTTPVTRPSYDWFIVDQHQQFAAPSCIPSSIEMVLKLEHRVPVDYYELQRAWGKKTDGTFADFDGRSIGGLTFHRQFFLPRTFFFPTSRLFQTID